MDRLFVECTVRAALLVGGTAIVLFLMRVKNAAATHTVWSGALALMLGLPIWTVWGPKVSLRLLPPLAQVKANEPIGPAGTLTATLAPSYLDSNWQRFLLGLYLLGSGVLVFRLLMGTIRADKLVRGAVLRNGVRINPRCAAPVTVGFLHPVTVFPEHWHKWSEAQLKAILIHEGEHATRRDSLVQWFALLNRALFWFHPVAWWLERKLSALAEEACDDAVIGMGHSPREYAECLLDIARSVMRSGSRLNVTGMAMPGGSLAQRIRKIIEGGPAVSLSRVRMACVIAAWATTSTVIAASSVDHVRPKSSPPDATTQRAIESASRATTKFVLGDLKLEGEVHDRDGVRTRVLKAWRERPYDDMQELVGEVLEVGIRQDFMERGYFKVVVHDAVSKPLGFDGGNERVLIVAPVAEGPQFQLGILSIQNAAEGQPLDISVATLRDQFRLQEGDVFNVSELRLGLERVAALYKSRGYDDVIPEPDTAIHDTTHRIDFIVRITEGTAAKPQVAAQAEQPSPPSCRYCPNPEYPPEARKAKIPDATVLLEIVVLESGDADKHNIRVLKEDPPGDGFGDKAVAAVKNWKFNPPTKNGKPVKAKTKVEVRFRLAD